MIAKTYIEQNLNDLERRYRKAKTRKEPLFLSKLAVLELCGWLETSIDDLVCRAVRRTVRDAAAIQNFESEVVKPVYGFHYKKHFRRMMCSAIGEIKVHEIERSMDQLKLQQLISELNALTTNRNALAHTYIKGITQNIDAPSRTLGRYRVAYASLKEFEREVFARI